MMRRFTSAPKPCVARLAVHVEQALARRRRAARSGCRRSARGSSASAVAISSRSRSRTRCAAARPLDRRAERLELGAPRRAPRRRPPAACPRRSTRAARRAAAPSTPPSSAARVVGRPVRRPTSSRADRARRSLRAGCAASRTVRANGPTWSSEDANAIDAVAADAAVRRLQPDDAAERGGWRIEPPVSVPSAPRHWPRRDRRGRAARRAARDAREVPRVARRAERGVLGRRAHRELVAVGLAEQHRAGRRAAGASTRGVVRRDEVLEDLRRRGRADARGHEDVLERDRHAGERRKRLAPREPFVRGGCLPAGLAVAHGEKCMQARLGFLDAPQTGLHELARGQLATGEAPRGARQRERGGIDVQAGAFTR